MSNEALADELIRLLGSRTNAYYIYHESGEKCKPAKGETKFGNYRDLPLTVDVIKQHLDKKITIGILPHNLNDECIFLAIDIDYHKDAGDDKSKIKTNYKDAKRIRDYLWNEHKLIGLIEKSGSKSSYHVWTFFEPTPGSKVRSFALGMLKELKISPDDVEIFPKQDKASTKEKKYGTQIKCPCGIHRKTKKRSRFLMPGYLGEPLKDITKITNHEILARYFKKIKPAKLPTLFDVDDEIEEEPNISFEKLLLQQPLCIRAPFLFPGMKIPKRMKFRGAYNLRAASATDKQIQRWFMNQKDYDEEKTISNIKRVTGIMVNEIWKEERIDPKGEFDPAKIKEKLLKIETDLRHGKYSRKIKWSCKILSTECGKKMKRKLCEGICQAQKNYRRSTNNFDSIKAERGAKIPIIKIIWKEINKKKNENRDTYIQASTDKLQKVLDKYPELGITDVELLVKFYFVPMGFMKTRKDGQLTHSTSSGSKYRFDKEMIDHVLKTE